MTGARRRITRLAAALIATVFAAGVAGAQPPPAWTHRSVCLPGGGGSDAPTPADGFLFADVAATMDRLAGTAQSSANCVSVAALIDALPTTGGATPWVVTMDLPSFLGLSPADHERLRAAGLQVVNPRLAARPVVFYRHHAAPADTPPTGVGIYIDPDVDYREVRTLAEEVLWPNQANVAPAARPQTLPVFEFQNLGVLAMCLGGGTPAGRRTCPQVISHAVVVETDGTTTTRAFEEAYQSATRSEVAKVTLDRGTVNSMQERLGTRPTALLVEEAGLASAYVLRPVGRTLESRRAREASRDEGWMSRLFALVETPLQAATSLRYPYVVILASASLPEPTLQAVSDAYIRVLSRWPDEPCTSATEQIHRALLLNAHLSDAPSTNVDQLAAADRVRVQRKRAGLASEMAATRRDGIADPGLARLVSDLNLPGRFDEWSGVLGLAADAAGCEPLPEGERFSSVRLRFADRNGQLTSQLRARAYIQRQTGDRADNLRRAAACVRIALAAQARPQCYEADRSTYSAYYNPFFYLALQDAISRSRP